MSASSVLNEELANIFAALRIHSACAFSYADAAPVQVPAPTPGTTAQLALTGALRDLLYGRCYTRCDAIVAQTAADDAPPAPAYGAAAQPDMIPSLTQANRTADHWDPGWSIYQLNGDGRIAVQKGDRSRSAVIGEYAGNKAPGVTPQVGDRVHLRVCPGSAELQPGFYHAFGAALSDQYDECALLRFYFNVTAAGAPELLRNLSEQFNRYAIPYRYKSLSYAAAYTRADAAVLYVAKRYYAIAAALVSGVAAALDEPLRPATPLFCSEVCPGVGLAEEPGSGESFGMHRCRLLAEGIVDAWLSGAQSVEARLDAVRKRFGANGLDLNLPYLNAGSVDLCAQPVFTGGIDP